MSMSKLFFLLTILSMLGLVWYGVLVLSGVLVANNAIAAIGLGLAITFVVLGIAAEEML